MDPDEATQRLIAAWNVDGDEERLGMLEDCCAPDARFVSPQGEISGLEGFSASIGAFRRAFQRAMVVMGEVDCNHGFARLRWETRWNDGREPLSGDDFVSFGPADGLIQLVVSFDSSPGAPAE